jgi:hypothetical protein
MSDDRISRIKPFDIYDYLKLGDLERCPYVWGTPECNEWNKQDKKRLTLIALERYADYLTTGRHDYVPPRGIEEA